MNTLLGCVAEGEFVCDSSGKPLIVQDLSDNFGSAEPVKPLPPNGHRMALVTASFQVLTPIITNLLIKTIPVSGLSDRWRADWSDSFQCSADGGSWVQGVSCQVDRLADSQ